jgi:polyisoprenoid-binding protein YceI
MIAQVIVRNPDAINQLPEGQSYLIANDSVVSWEARKVGGFHTGTVGISTGVVVVSSGEVVGAQFEIAMPSIAVSDIPATDEGNAKLVGELKEFFNVNTYPTATFFLTSLSGDVAQGDLTINGITKTIEFPATIVVNGTTATIKADFFIQRSQWNLTKWEGMVQEELKISFDLTATAVEASAPVVNTGEVLSGSAMTGEVMSGSMTTGEVMSGTVETPATTGETMSGTVATSGNTTN